MCLDFLFSWSAFQFIELCLSISILLNHPISIISFVAPTLLITTYLFIHNFIDGIVTIGRDLNWDPIRNFTFAKISLAIPSLSFALSVLYNYIYLNSLGISLKNSPISLGDYTLTALIWAPVVALYAMLVLISAYLDSIQNPKIDRWTICRLFFIKFLVIIIPGYLLLENFKLFDITKLGIASFMAASLFTILVILFQNSIGRYRELAYPADRQSELIDRFKFFIVWHIYFFIGIFSFLLFLIPNYAEVSTKCPQNGAHISGKHVLVKEGIQIDGVLARTFATHYLIRNCESEGNMHRMEFIRADRVDKMVVEP